MKLLYSNLKPCDYRNTSFSEAFESGLVSADRIKIATGYITEDSLLELKSIPRESYPNMLYSKLENLVQELLTKKDQEHKAELGRIKGEIEGGMFADSRETGQFRLHSDGYNQGIEDPLSIIDRHINSLTTE